MPPIWASDKCFLVTALDADVLIIDVVVADDDEEERARVDDDVVGDDGCEIDRRDDPG